MQEESWNEVKTEKEEAPKVEFEVEEEVKKEEPVVEAKEEKEEPKKEAPKELDGIDTKGAQKKN
jgi:hypothetical protein